MSMHRLTMQRFERACRRIVFLAVALLMLCAGALAFADAQLVAVPPFKSSVTDRSNVLQAPERAQLEARLAAIDQQTGSQVAVLLLPTTQPEDIAAYSIRVADAWKPGRKNVDDGVILIVATQDRKLRIEVGRGLEGAIPDVTAKRIIDETIAPGFKRGEFYAGITAGVERINARIGGEALPPPARGQANGDNRGNGGLAGLFPIIIFIVFVLIAIFRRGNRSAYYSRGGSGSGLAGFATGVLLDSILRGGGRGGGGLGGGGGGGWSGGGGGGFGGGGASGDW
jgi:uncharacterized protein